MNMRQTDLVLGPLFSSAHTSLDARCPVMFIFMSLLCCEALPCDVHKSTSTAAPSASTDRVMLPCVVQGPPCRKSYDQTSGVRLGISVDVATQLQGMNSSSMIVCNWSNCLVNVCALDPGR